MENLLKDFDISAKNPSEEAQRRWRSAVAVVRNRLRRFRMVADQAKRDAARTKILETQLLQETLHSHGVDENVITQVIVTRAEEDLKDIKKLYYKTDLLTLLGKED